jgi:hypothetical protein
MWCGHGVVGLEWAVAQVIGDWTPAPTVVCVWACKATGYARESLPLCDGDRNAVAPAPKCMKRAVGATAALGGEVVGKGRLLAGIDGRV